MKKKYSLKQNNVFNDVLKKGRKNHSEFFLLSKSRHQNNYGHIRIGISIPKKFGNAVFRNKQKRQIKNIIDSFFIDIKDKNVDLIILAKKPFFSLSFIEKQTILEKKVKEFIINGTRT